MRRNEACYCELPRIPLPRNRVNRGNKKDRAALERVSWRARLNEKMSDESQRWVCAGRDKCSDDWFGNETPTCFMGATVCLGSAMGCSKTLSQDYIGGRTLKARICGTRIRLS